MKVVTENYQWCEFDQDKESTQRLHDRIKNEHDTEIVMCRNEECYLYMQHYVYPIKQFK